MIEKTNQYLHSAESVGIFKQEELKILGELLEDRKNNPNSHYFIYDKKKNDKICGFIIFGKTPMTDFCWDIYWLIVHKDFQSSGVGIELFKKAENFMTSQNAKTAIRVETSSRKEYEKARIFYTKRGFKEAGRIPDFYSKGDDLLIFYKNSYSVKNVV